MVYRRKPAGKSATGGAPDQPLIDAILAAYDDDAPRLVYADQLLERGDARGELIPLQCELTRAAAEGGPATPAEAARLARLAKRERALLREHGAAWTADLHALAKHLTFGFARGLVESVSGPSVTLFPVADRLLERAPFLCELALVLYEPTLAPLLASPLMDRLRTLTVAGGRRVDLRALRERTTPSPLRVLRIEHGRLLRDDLAALVGTACLPALRVLEIRGTQFGKEAIAPLADLRTPLDELALVTTHAPDTLVRVLTTAPGLARLRALAITNNPIGDEGLAALLASGRLASVAELDLRSDDLSADAVHRLLDASPNGYRRLQLGGNALDDSVAVRIAHWPGAARLEKLDLGSPDITDEGVIALARSPYLDAVRSIVLSNVRASPRAAALLRASPHLARARLYVGERFLAKP